MRVAAQESTQADDNRRRLELHGAQAEAMAPMAGRRPRLDVAAGILQVAHAAIADVAQEIRLVEQLENERRIGVRQWSQSQSRGLGEHALPMLVDAGLRRKRGGAASTPTLTGRVRKR